MEVSKKASKGAVNTAATSLASSLGIKTSCAEGNLPSFKSASATERVTRLSPELFEADGLEDSEDAGIRDIEGMSSGSASKKATHGLTPRLVRARLRGSWQRWWILKGGGSSESERGRPISSYASRRAVAYGVSWRESALPPGKAACPASANYQ
jgi:hypothetical protein